MEFLVGMWKDAFLLINVILKFAPKGFLVILESFHKWTSALIFMGLLFIVKIIFILCYGMTVGDELVDG
jgi:hypothetical protein